MLQRYLSIITYSIQRHCYPGIAIGDHKGLMQQSFSINKTLCKFEFPYMSMTTVENEKDCTMYSNNNNNNKASFLFAGPAIVTEVGLSGFTWRQIAI